MWSKIFLCEKSLNKECVQVVLRSNISCAIILWRNVGCNVELDPSNDMINHTPEIWICMVACVSMCSMNHVNFYACE